jgi:hypothetical protein
MTPYCPIGLAVSADGIWLIPQITRILFQLVASASTPAARSLSKISTALVGYD